MRAWAAAASALASVGTTARRAPDGVRSRLLYSPSSLGASFLDLPFGCPYLQSFSLQPSWVISPTETFFSAPLFRAHCALFVFATLAIGMPQRTLGILASLTIIRPLRAQLSIHTRRSRRCRTSLWNCCLGRRTLLRIGGCGSKAVRLLGASGMQK